jgi:5-(carboxyamino)imidazole ribonucleotide mutase
VDSKRQPLIGVILGSKSDLPQAVKIAETLDSLDVPFEVTVASAHRTPEDVTTYARKARSRGLKVLIGVAGLAAALPGSLAAETTLPVIGLPVAGGALGGMDALLAIAQMPPGIPVAAVGLNSGQNAALLAVRILALSDDRLQEVLWDFQAQASDKVRASRKELENLPSAPDEAFR